MDEEVRGFLHEISHCHVTSGGKDHSSFTISSLSALDLCVLNVILQETVHPLESSVVLDYIIGNGFCIQKMIHNNVV